MRRLGLVLLALTLVFATTAVPARLAAKAASRHDAAVAWQAAALAGGEIRTGSEKRCQGGAGLLGCPFLRAAVPEAPIARDGVPVRFDPSGPVLTGLVVPTSSGPPRHLSA